MVLEFNGIGRKPSAVRQVLVPSWLKTRARSSMRPNKTVLLAIVASLSTVLCACEASYYISNNSSQGDNDYFEEPISERSKKYASALDTSNRFIEHFTSGDMQAVRELMDPRLRQKAPVEALQSMYENVDSHYGSLVEFKPLQWGFATHTDFENVLVSVKIVLYDKGQAFYTFKFEDNGVYNQIIGFKIWPRENNATVNEAVAKAFASE